MNKKIEEQLRIESQKIHPIYETFVEKRAPIKCGSMYVYPLEPNNFVTPYSKLTLETTDDYRKQILELAHAEDAPIFIVTAEDWYIDEGETISKFKGEHGVMATIFDLKPGADNSDEPHTALVQTVCEGEINKVPADTEIMKASVVERDLKLLSPTIEHTELENLFDSLFKAILEFLVEDTRQQIQNSLSTLPSHSLERFSFMILNSPLEQEERESVYALSSIAERLEKAIGFLSLHHEKLMIRNDLSRRTMQQMNDNQRNEFLRNQIKNMQQELSADVTESDEDELQQRADKLECSEETRQAFDKEMRKLLRYAVNSPEYAMQYSYLDTFLNLPWLHCDNNDFELSEVERILDRDHYALEKVKDRIVEQMAVMKLRKDTHAPILCLVGPPGVGKTSLGKSVAEALGRKYVRVALGGVHDEAEIRGHRRTYLGSMPGRIITALEKCGTSDPVMVLDEIDKLGADYKGDPQTALLEVLDPEQNSRFHDNFIDHDYDLSKILFIATANSLDPISTPLLDRMEIIEIGGYVEDEKIEIAKRHLIPRNLERHGFDKDELTITDEGLHEIIRHYTRESGVRRLEKRIAEILRKLARSKVSGKEFSHSLGRDDVRQLLGRESNFPDECENNDIAGVVTGLAWTQAGGEILFIESSISPGKESKLTLTGNLGDVMKESAMLALQYLKANAGMLGLDEKSFEGKNLHIHVPEGAIPKDGPSAGIAMLTSVASAFTHRKVRARLAMTGELTLRGRVLPVGGIKEKILAAKRAGITDVVLCTKNRKDIEEIPSQYLEGLTFHYVDSAAEVLAFALLDELAD